VYLSNMQRAGAEHSVSTFYHTWFAHGSPLWDVVTDTTPGPAPGFLVGGANPYYTLDGCCTSGAMPLCYGAEVAVSYCGMAVSPPAGQPSAKSYLEFNESWPANSWSVTENSNGYQVQYIRLLSAFAR
jgi:endoglucanase